MTDTITDLTPRERELGAIILQYNEVTERLKGSHELLLAEVARLRDELADKNRELARRERLAALGHMAAGLAHEIRNPLGGIQLYASLLARDLTDSPKQFQIVEKIDRAVRLLDGLVGDILAFANPTEPQRRQVTLGQVVDQVAELIAPRLVQCGVTLRVDDACRDVELWADPRQLQQILMNVLLNAVEAAVEGGERDGRPWVSLSAEPADRDGQTAIVRIADSGPGIDPDQLHHVFNPFYTTKDSGTGLGLAIVHQLVEAHGGSITASGDDDGGALFTLRLPAASDASVVAADVRE